MRVDDLPGVRDLALQLGYGAPLERLQARFARILQRPEQALFVATRGGQVAGWLHAQSQHPLESDPYVEITGLVVAEDARRRGLGRALVERARSWALDLGYTALGVSSNVQRLEAHRFYPALGFRITKTQHTYTLEASRRGP